MISHEGGGGQEKGREGKREKENSIGGARGRKERVKWRERVHGDKVGKRHTMSEGKSQLTDKWRMSTCIHSKSTYRPFWIGGKSGCSSPLANSSVAYYDDSGHS